MRGRPRKAAPRRPLPEASPFVWVFPIDGVLEAPRKNHTLVTRITTLALGHGDRIVPVRPPSDWVRLDRVAADDTVHAVPPMMKE